MADSTKTTLPTLEELMEAGVHFGHRTRQWNPKMAPYIYGVLEQIHIIDLEKTLAALKTASEFLSKKKSEGATIVLVGTKRQAAPVVKALGIKHKLYYVTERWPGGLITNFPSIHNAIVHYEEVLTQLQDEAYMDSLSTKEKYALKKEAERLGKILGGLRGLDKKPNVLVIIDPRREKTAVLEGKKAGAKIIGIVDTNSNPEDADYPVPANDDAIKSIEVVLGALVGE